MICLGIESTSHTFGIGIVDDKGRILANVCDMFIPQKGKGIVPREAAQHHSEIAAKVIQDALDKAKIKLDDVDLIAFSRGPGLMPCLRVGAAAARALALKTGKPLVDVNHPVAHIEIGKLTTGAKDPVVVYVSGGNTQILALNEGRYRVFGETLDIPIGNCLDQVAREIGLGNPGGPQIEKNAIGSGNIKGGKYFELPYIVKGMDLSFAGISTAAVKKFKEGKSVQDVCFSLQETCFAMLVEVTERALAHTGKKEVLVVGGVAANKRFAQMLDIMCKERGAKAFAVPMEYATDNGVMIAWAGMLSFAASSESKRFARRVNLGFTQSQSYKESKETVDPKWRADEVDVLWTSTQFR